MAPARVTLMRLPGPTEPASRVAEDGGGGGVLVVVVGGRVAEPTAKSPNIVVACGSHWKW